MKKLVWVAGAILLFAMVFPNGIDFSKVLGSKPAAVVVSATPDSTIVKKLATASSADKARVVSVYSGLKTVLQRDKAKRINTTEKFAETHANTLQMAIENPGKYPGLDDAIEAVFAAAVADANADTTVVNPVTPEIQAKLISACDTVIVSAR